MLADGVDTFEHASVHDPRDPGREPARIRALGLDPVADKRAKPGGGTVDRVALGHGRERRGLRCAARTGRRLHTPKS